MKKVNKCCENVLDMVKKEIAAGMVMFPKNERDKVWNSAHIRALDFIDRYKRGNGLFQYDD